MVGLSSAMLTDSTDSLVVELAAYSYFATYTFPCPIFSVRIVEIFNSYDLKSFFQAYESIKLE